ncbi:MAG TPA: GNAT family N-acetyltransferase [Stellaceae bacterium]
MARLAGIEEVREDADAAPVWRPLDGKSLADPALCAELQRLIAAAGSSLLMHDPAWFGAGAAVPEAEPGARPGALFVAHSAGSIVGYAPFVAGRRVLRFALGELIFHRHGFSALSLLHDIVAPGDAEVRTRLLRALFETLASRLGRNDAVFLEGVPVGSPLHRLASAPTPARGLLSLRLGEIFRHRFAELPASFEEYEGQLGSSTRQSLRRQHRKLVQHVEGDLRLVRFSAASEIAEFVSDARKISQKTYQWRLLGLGLRDAAALEDSLGFAARRGWLRSYILYCRGEPVAFMLGYQYRGTYHYIDVGYDPAWAKWSVGSVLQMEMMKDLLDGPARPVLFDFSTGFGEHKARFGHGSRDEVNLVLLRRCPRNMALAAFYAASATADKRLAAGLDRLGVKKWAKRLLRRRA